MKDFGIAVPLCRPARGEMGVITASLLSSERLERGKERGRCEPRREQGKELCGGRDPTSSERDESRDSEERHDRVETRGASSLEVPGERDARRQKKAVRAAESAGQGKRTEEERQVRERRERGRKMAERGPEPGASEDEEPQK